MQHNVIQICYNDVPATGNKLLRLVRQQWTHPPCCLPSVWCI